MLFQSQHVWTEVLDTSPRLGKNGDEEMVRVLLYGGADLTLKSNNGKTALDLAKEDGDEETIAVLVAGITKRLKLKRG